MPNSFSQFTLAPILEHVHGDVLPALNTRVLIHLARPDAWVERTVVGYYVWKSLSGDEWHHRVFVRVKDDEGHLNARLLKDIRYPEHTQTEAPAANTVKALVDAAEQHAARLPEGELRDLLQKMATLLTGGV